MTGGGTHVDGVAAHLAYIGRQGEIEIETETDEGERVKGRDAHKALIKDWHLELSRGQYRRSTKLVHHLVLSMPASTPPERLLAAARKFAREKFAVQHRYAMALHTDQRHPHVHLVVKAKRKLGQERLHITKPMLREWRADFARALREQGIAANSTPSVLRGRTKRRNRNGLFRARSRGASSVFRSRVRAIADELARTGSIRDPARSALLETRGQLSVFDRVRCCYLSLQLRTPQDGQITGSGDLPRSSRCTTPATGTASHTCGGRWCWAKTMARGERSCLTFRSTAGNCFSIRRLQ